jgi:hypothetical protein
MKHWSCHLGWVETSLARFSRVGLTSSLTFSSLIFFFYGLGWSESSLSQELIVLQNMNQCSCSAWDKKGCRSGGWWGMEEEAHLAPEFQLLLGLKKSAPWITLIYSSFCIDWREDKDKNLSPNFPLFFPLLVGQQQENKGFNFKIFH